MPLRYPWQKAGRSRSKLNLSRTSQECADIVRGCGQATFPAEVSLVGFAPDRFYGRQSGVPGLCCTNRLRDSCRESSAVAGLHEQTNIADLQDYELNCLQWGAEAPRVTNDLVRSQDEVGCQPLRQEGQFADLQ